MKQRHKPKQNPYEPPDYHPNQVRAIQALFNFEADPEQQRIAVDCIMRWICERGVNAYRPSDRDTNFALGKQWVADQLAFLFNADLRLFEHNKNLNESQGTVIFEPPKKRST